MLAPVVLMVSVFFWRGKSVGLTGGTIQAMAMVFWILALLGLADLLRPRLPRLAAIGSVLLVYGGLAGNNFAVDGMFEGALEAAGARYSPEALSAAFGPSVYIVFLVPGLLFPLTILMFSLGLWRARVIPVLWMVALALAAIAFPLGRIPRLPALAHATDALLILTLAPLGWRYLRARA